MDELFEKEEISKKEYRRWTNNIIPQVQEIYSTRLTLTITEEDYQAAVQYNNDL